MPSPTWEVDVAPTATAGQGVGSDRSGLGTGAVSVGSQSFQQLMDASAILKNSAIAEWQARIQLQAVRLQEKHLPTLSKSGRRNRKNAASMLDERGHSPGLGTHNKVEERADDLWGPMGPPVSETQGARVFARKRGTDATRETEAARGSDALLDRQRIEVTKDDHDHDQDWAGPPAPASSPNLVSTDSGSHGKKVTLQGHGMLPWCQRKEEMSSQGLQDVSGKKVEEGSVIPADRSRESCETLHVSWAEEPESRVGRDARALQCSTRRPASGNPSSLLQQESSDCHIQHGALSLSQGDTVSSWDGKTPAPVVTTASCLKGEVINDHARAGMERRIFSDMLLRPLLVSRQSSISSSSSRSLLAAAIEATALPPRSTNRSTQGQGRFSATLGESIASVTDEASPPAVGLSTSRSPASLQMGSKFLQSEERERATHHFIDAQNLIRRAQMAKDSPCEDLDSSLLSKLVVNSSATGPRGGRNESFEDSKACDDGFSSKEAERTVSSPLAGGSREEGLGRQPSGVRTDSQQLGSDGVEIEEVEEEHHRRRPLITRGDGLTDLLCPERREATPWEEVERRYLQAYSEGVRVMRGAQGSHASTCRDMQGRDVGEDHPNSYWVVFDHRSSTIIGKSKQEKLGWNVQSGWGKTTQIVPGETQPVSEVGADETRRVRHSTAPVFEMPVPSGQTGPSREEGWSNRAPGGPRRRQQGRRPDHPPWWEGRIPPKLSGALLQDCSKTQCVGEVGQSETRAEDGRHHGGRCPSAADSFLRARIREIKQGAAAGTKQVVRFEPSSDSPMEYAQPFTAGTALGAWSTSSRDATRITANSSTGMPDKGKSAICESDRDTALATCSVDASLDLPGSWSDVASSDDLSSEPDDFSDLSDEDSSQVLTALRRALSEALDEMGATRKGCEERRYGVPPTTPAPLRVSSPVVDSSNGEKRAQVEWKGEKSSDGVRSEAFSDREKVADEVVETLGIEPVKNVEQSPSTHLQLVGMGSMKPVEFSAADRISSDEEILHDEGPPVHLEQNARIRISANSLSRQEETTENNIRAPKSRRALEVLEGLGDLPLKHLHVKRRGIERLDGYSIGDKNHAKGLHSALQRLGGQEVLRSLSFDKPSAISDVKGISFSEDCAERRMREVRRLRNVMYTGGMQILRNKNDPDRRVGCTSSLDESSRFHGIMLNVAIYPKSKEVSPGCTPGEEESRSFIQCELERRRREWDQYARSGQWDELSKLERMDLTDAERKELAETIESKMLSAITAHSTKFGAMMMMKRRKGGAGGVLAAVEAAEKALKIRQRFLRKFLFHGKREKVDDDGSDEDQYRTSHWDYFPRIRRSGKISKAVSVENWLKVFHEEMALEEMGEAYCKQVVQLKLSSSMLRRIGLEALRSLGNIDLLSGIPHIPPRLFVETSVVANAVGIAASLQLKDREQQLKSMLWPLIDDVNEAFADAFSKQFESEMWVKMCLESDLAVKEVDRSYCDRIKGIEKQQYLHWCEMERRHQEGIAASAVEALCLQKPFKESSGIKALRRAVKVLCQVKEPSKATDKEAEMRLLLEREREAYVKRMERQSMDEKARRFAAWANLQEQKTQQFSQELDAALRRHGAAVRAARALQDVHLLNTRMRFLSMMRKTVADFKTKMRHHFLPVIRTNTAFQSMVGADSKYARKSYSGLPDALRARGMSPTRFSDRRFVLGGWASGGVFLLGGGNGLVDFKMVDRWPVKLDMKTTKNDYSSLPQDSTGRTSIEAVTRLPEAASACNLPGGMVYEKEDESQNARVVRCSDVRKRKAEKRMIWQRSASKMANSRTGCGAVYAQNHGQIWVVGGMMGGAFPYPQTQTEYWFATDSGGLSHEGPRLAIGRRFFGSAIDPSHVSVVGPTRVSESTKCGLRFEKPKLALVGDCLYAVGGEGKHPKATSMCFLSDMEVLSLKDNPKVWMTSKVTLPEPRVAMGCASEGRCLYLFGGFDGEHYLSSCLVCDPQALSGDNVFKTLPPLSAPRAHPATLKVGKSIWVIGGFDFRGPITSVMIFNLETNMWLEGPDLRLARGGAAAAFVEDSVMVFGGAGRAGVLDSIEKVHVSFGTEAHQSALDGCTNERYIHELSYSVASFQFLEERLLVPRAGGAALVLPAQEVRS